MSEKTEITQRNMVRRILAASICVFAQLTVSGASAQNDQVRVQLSTREAWVGAPIVLQIEIRDARDYKLPELPEIDGVDFRSARAPSTSTQIQISNGRRLESSSISMQYQLTPRREGAFEIPALVLEVDGQEIRTKPLKFVATKSETGDLLFAEISGKQDRVYVGQSLDLTLKIWIKPFRDRDLSVTLSETDMWQMISEQTRWGSFLDRLQDMARDRQRPAGQEVLRDDGEGNQRSYYLYEIESTVYPKQAGRIGADEVQIVVNYPQSLGRSRDPFDDFFGGSLFEGSPFGNRLSVASSRPVIAAVSVDSIEVLPVPATGRPADYRGAVGQYQIVTQAISTTVAAGDPIELGIGIVGDGPMELVQAPPLASLPELTGDFKVPDQPLAGFVQDNTKVFSATIRPRHEGITQIPAIPFSFFDPEREQFQTVYSQPIKITVNASESLALEAIVSARRSNSASPDDLVSGQLAHLNPDFTNFHGPELLESTQAKSQSTKAKPASQGWILAVVTPPLALVVVLLGRGIMAMLAVFGRLQPARRMGLRWIDACSTPEELANALVRYLARRLGLNQEKPQAAMGALRVAGLYELAARIDGFLDRCVHDFSSSTEFPFETIRNSARELLTETERELARNHHSQVRPIARPNLLKGVSRKNPSRPLASAILIALVFGTPAIGSLTVQDNSARPYPVAGTVELDHEQQSKLLEEAAGLYSRATQLAESDTTEARELFAGAAEKYQLLTDSGIRNPGLYANLANAFLQSDQSGRAIANYRRSLNLDPVQNGVRVNLDFAQTLIAKPAGGAGSKMNGAVGKANGSWRNLLTEGERLGQRIPGWTGRMPILVVVTVSSIVFWGLLIARALGYRIPVVPWGIVPGVLLVLSAGILWCADCSRTESQTAIVVVDSLSLHAGDGNHFGSVATIALANGMEVEVLSQRGGWSKVRAPVDQQGWVETRDLELL